MNLTLTMLSHTMLYMLVVFLPLFNAIICWFFSNFIKQKKLLKSVIVSMFISTIHAVDFCFYHGGQGYTVQIEILRWIETENIRINWDFYFDNTAVVMMALVTFISTLVHVYSFEYMKNDPHIIRFFSYLSFFTFFMLFLVSANNLVQLFVGWEGVGLCSYLLINFWFTRVQANKAALKALIMNRIGDFSFLLSLVLIFKYFKSFDFGVLLNKALIENIAYLNIHADLWVNPIVLITLLMFLAAVGKSAQLGLHTWLPDAMEGPTPVSALIHAATMVTAGVFLIIRCSSLFIYSPEVCKLMSIVGVLTAVVAGLIGLVQYDIKKIIAYSTCSQLGYMIFACGLNQFSLSFFHLINHGFFKALLFLSAGAVIHALNDEQDIRKMGGLTGVLPFLHQAFLIGSLALAGIPFLTGFYSKDLLLEISFGTSTNLGQYLFWLGVLGAGLTAYYSTRLMYYVFWTTPNGYKVSYANVHQPDRPITFVLFLLIMASIFYGWYYKDLFVGLGTNYFYGSIDNGLYNNNYDTLYDLPIVYKFLPFFVTIFSIIAAIVLCNKFSSILTILQTQSFLRNIFILFNKKWFFDSLYNIVGLKFLNYGFSISYSFFDKGVLELFGPLGITNAVYFTGRLISKFHNGLVTNLMQLFFIGFFIFLNIVFISVA